MLDGTGTEGGGELNTNGVCTEVEAASKGDLLGAADV